MKQRKIAVSLAIVGALATPFVFRTYKMHPTSRTWLPMSAESKEHVLAYMQKTENCREFADRVQQLGNASSVKDLAPLESCRFEQKALQEGGVYGQRPSILFYLALNAAVAALSGMVIFVMTYLLPALVRRYWRWLNT